MPHVDYQKILEQASKYATDGFNNPAQIDETIAPILTCQYNIYSLYPRGRSAVCISYEGRSSGEERLQKLIDFLVDVGDENFPKLRDGIIEIMIQPRGENDGSFNGYYSDSKNVEKKFNVKKFLEKNFSRLSADFQRQIITELQEKAPRLIPKTLKDYSDPKLKTNTLE